MVIHAPDLAGARAAADAALAERQTDDSDWSLGLLRPLTPRAPGTHHYRAVFALWTSTADRFVRRDMHSLDVWAADAQSARRLAQQEVRLVDGYQPAWRIRQVIRMDEVDGSS